MRSNISGIQIPTNSRLNIDGGLTLDSLAGTSGHMLISQGANVTPIWSNTLTSPTINTSLVAGSASFDLLTTVATTINFGSSGTINIGNSTGSKTVNIATSTTSPESSTVRIGTAEAATSSNIYLQGQIFTGKLVTSTGNASGYSGTIYGAQSIATGTSTGNAVGGSLTILSGEAAIESEFNTAGTATSGALRLDAGSAITQGGAATGGVINIGNVSASAVNIGRAAITTTINGSLTSAVPNLPSQTANTFFASPNSAAGTPAFRVLSYRDIYPAGLPTTFGQVIEYAPVGGGLGWTGTPPLLKGGGTMTGALVTTATTTSIAPIRLPSGTVPLLASQEFGMLAANAESLQLSTTKTTGAGPGFGFIRAPQMVYAVANSSAATSTTPVSPFAAANDVLSSLEIGKSYRFRGVYYFTSTFTSGTPAIQLAFAFSNAPVIFKYNYQTYRSAGQSTFELVGQSSTTVATTVSGTVTATRDYVVQFEGFFTSNATLASTLTPRFQMAAVGVSTVATAGSFFEIEKLGTSSQTLIAGNWG